MKKQLAGYWFLIWALVVATGVVLWAVFPREGSGTGDGNEGIFELLLGLVAGAVLTVIPQAIFRGMDRARRTRAAAVLLRSDFFAYQVWIEQGLRDSKWGPTPKEISTVDHIADLAHALPDWDEWQTIGQARRYTNRMVGLSNRPEIDNETRRHGLMTFDAIDEAMEVLAKIDDGPAEPHGSRESVVANSAPRGGKEVPSGNDAQGEPDPLP
ncbi:hypothetical protein [Microbacterium sp. CR_7]|uniref:hypothetical protein n=1 Tax=Microbacterium sp. CR_7 TaxID=3055792 RepID=UPI0035BF8E03